MFGGGRSYAAQAGVGVSSDSFIDESAAAYLRRELSIMLDLQNDKQGLEASHEWSGVMGFSRDDYPWVGEITEEIADGGGEGLWICGGYTGNGMPNAWLCGKAVVDLIVSKHESDVDLPVEYRVSKERVEKARRDHDEVWIADQDALRPIPIAPTISA
jgi:glycine/D-amino acid oxidase-like deaminating enzyme